MAGRTGGPLTRQLAFWDASALVPLCVHQTNTPQSLLWRRRYQTVIWWLTPVEIASALARLLRIGQLDTNGWGRALKLGRALDEAWFVIKPTEAFGPEPLISSNATICAPQTHYSWLPL